MMEPRPTKRAAAWLFFLGPFFFATYGFANWLASTRAGVGAIVFDWERAIPFVAWTIVPYWSIDFLYALSPFVCTTKRELDRHAQRLLLVQVICVIFFIIFPLRFTFTRPEASGFFGFLFAALGSFDKPFNQAPSLHIALLVIIWVRLAAHIGARRRPLLHGWMLLIGVSVLTTYQHHFIDIPTGVLVGFAAAWALPEGVSPFAQWALTADRRRRALALRYGVGAAICAALAFLGGFWLWMFWPAVALALVALNYLGFGARGFQKGSDGRLSVGAYGLLAPYLAGAWINSRLWTRKLPRSVEVIDGVCIGRLPAARDLASFDAVVDVSAELPCAVPSRIFYRPIPLLDLIVPDPGALAEAARAVEEARAHGRVLVCCSLGFSRSAAAVAAWLITTRRAPSVEAAMAAVRQARPAIVLQRGDSAALEALA